MMAGGEARAHRVEHRPTRMSRRRCPIQPAMRGINTPLPWRLCPSAAYLRGAFVPLLVAPVVAVDVLPPVPIVPEPDVPVVDGV